VRASYDPVHLRAGYTEDLQGRSLSELVSRRRCRVLSDLRRYAERRATSPATQVLLKEGIRSSLSCPLVIGDEVVGILFRSARQPHAFDDHQLCVHLAMAERLARAVRSAIQIERLEAANHAYMEMLAFVSHELKNPVASLVTDVRLVQEGYLGGVNEAQLRKLAGVQRKGTYLLELIREYLDLARIEGGRLRPVLRAGTDLIEEVLEPAIEMVREEIDEAGMRLVEMVPESSIGVECDPGLLRVVLINLLGNAARYGRRGGTIRLHVSRSASRLAVFVWNEGPGFPPEQRHRLFRKFSRLDVPGQQQGRGTGVGLYNAWKIVLMHNGRIRARSEPGRWAEFWFEIPQPVGGRLPPG
jgi:signal transduction histidine kinase